MSDSVEFRHLEYLVAIEEGKNFTRAAERLYRSQPAISQQIRTLEEDVGFPIFVRGGRDGVSLTPSGELVLSWAREVLSERQEIFTIARAIHEGKVPNLRVGFSPFVNPALLNSFRRSYQGFFPGCSVQFSGSDSLQTLQRLERGALDCAVLPCPIDSKAWNVVSITQSALVVCMRTDDPLVSQTELDIHEIAPRIRVLRDPELHPVAHGRLMELFAEAGIPTGLANSVGTPADLQWMVRENYGLALIDQTFSVEPGLTTRPIAGVNWITETAFVAAKDARHIALPIVTKFLKQQSNGGVQKKRPHRERTPPSQLKLIG